MPPVVKDTQERIQSGQRAKEIRESLSRIVCIKIEEYVHIIYKFIHPSEYIRLREWQDVQIA